MALLQSEQLQQLQLVPEGSEAGSTDEYLWIYSLSVYTRWSLQRQRMLTGNVNVVSMHITNQVSNTFATLRRLFFHTSVASVHAETTPCLATVELHTFHRPKTHELHF